jgi:hypothetical protein
MAEIGSVERHTLGRKEKCCRDNCQLFAYYCLIGDTSEEANQPSRNRDRLKTSGYSRHFRVGALFTGGLWRVEYCFILGKTR